MKSNLSILSLRMPYIFQWRQSVAFSGRWLTAPDKLDSFNLTIKKKKISNKFSLWNKIFHLKKSCKLENTLEMRKFQHCFGITNKTVRNHHFLLIRIHSPTTASFPSSLCCSVIWSISYPAHQCYTCDSRTTSCMPTTSTLSRILQIQLLELHPSWTTSCLLLIEQVNHKYMSWLTKTHVDSLGLCFLILQCVNHNWSAVSSVSCPRSFQISLA